jgi:hypothetical protein|tara:strand:+ start:398 stop:556 length:159 start_codon:yes stop_codon:yes gene_type:complete
MDTKWDEVQFYEQIQAAKNFEASTDSPHLKTKWQKITNAMFEVMELIENMNG